MDALVLEDACGLDALPGRGDLDQHAVTADARRFVPSWDEPDYKARFTLTARVPAGEMAVSPLDRFFPEINQYVMFRDNGSFETIRKFDTSSTSYIA